jgi:hypothetical protein
LNAITQSGPGAALTIYNDALWVSTRCAWIKEPEHWLQPFEGLNGCWNKQHTLERQAFGFSKATFAAWVPPESSSPGARRRHVGQSLTAMQVARNNPALCSDLWDQMGRCEVLNTGYPPSALAWRAPRRRWITLPSIALPFDSLRQHSAAVLQQ